MGSLFSFIFSSFKKACPVKEYFDISALAEGYLSTNNSGNTKSRQVENPKRSFHASRTGSQQVGALHNLRDRFLSEEVIKLHYENLVGMARLAKTSHQLTHAGKLFVPLDSVFGNVNEFVHRYYDGLFPDQIETFNSLIAYDETYPGLPVKDPNIPWAYIGGFLKDI